jgi:hypothetical protein
MKNCEYAVKDDQWFYAYLYIIHVSQYMLWWIFSPICCSCCVFMVFALLEYRYSRRWALVAGCLEGGDGDTLL